MRILPRDEKFYDLFTELSQRLTASAALLCELFSNPAELDRKVSQIKELEHQADNLTHDIIDRIDRTFVTPFDREDIHAVYVGHTAPLPARVRAFIDFLAEHVRVSDPALKRAQDGKWKLVG